MAVTLVVDDDPAVRNVASRILRAAGHDVVTASNGVEAIGLYRFAPDRFDLVITDVTMPVMDGRQLALLVRETRPGARIICMSGLAEAGFPEGIIFLPKPFTAEALRASVDNLLRGLNG